MREVRHGRRSAVLVVAAMLTIAVPDATTAADPLPDGLLRCPTAGHATRIARAPRMFEWSSTWDVDGTIRGHHPAHRRQPELAGRSRGFADGPFRERLVTGERDPPAPPSGCSTWTTAA